VLYHPSRFVEFYYLVDNEDSYEEPRDEQYDYMGDQDSSAEEGGNKCLKCSKAPTKQSTTTSKPKTKKRGSTLCTLEEYQVFKVR
jgi:hypothetical protein